MTSAEQRPPAEVMIGVDVGTTAAKVVAFGVRSSWRHVSSREYPLLEPVPGHQVQDPDLVVTATVAALAECVAAVGDARVLGISLSTAMHGLIALDAERRPLTPLVTWADARSVDDSRALRASGAARDLHQRTGTPVHPMSPLVKLMWFRREEPATWAAARWWVGLKDYLLWRLTGTLATELSSASATGLLDRATRAWSPLAVETCGVAVDRLPDVLPTTAVLELQPDVAEDVGLPPGTPVVAGAADGPLGNLGSGAMGAGVVGLSLGTSGAVRMVVEDGPEVLDPSLFCYALTDRAWVVGGAVSNGGIVVRWLGHSVTPDIQVAPDRRSVDERVLELAAGIPPGSDGLVMLPYLLAERAPLWDPDLTGAYLGLRRTHTRAHMVRAAVEGVAMQLGTIVDRIDAAHPVATVRATGGAFAAPLWRDVLAAVVGRPLEVVGAAEGSALGAAALGMHALGLAPDLAQAPLVLGEEATDRVEPVPADPELVAAYERSRAAVPELVASLAAAGALFAR